MINLYHVFDADYANDAYPDIREILAYTPQEAGKIWAKGKWASYDNPDAMECIATELATGKRYRVDISVMAEPVFYASVREAV